MPEYLSAFDNFPEVHAHFFSREGGVSEGLYHSLNCGPGSDDLPENIQENRARVARTLNVSTDQLLSLYQIHSADVLIIEHPFSSEHRPKGDAMVTKQKNIALGVLTADCTPVLFCDPVAQIIGAAHAGWKGAVGGVLEATIDKMIKIGANRHNIHAEIGPTIAQKSYEVSLDFQQNVLAIDSLAASFFADGIDANHKQFNLPSYVADRLKRQNIASIFDHKVDTYTTENLYFSYRRSCHKKEPDYARQISAICLR